MNSEQHRLYGRHSNIPECCIEAYVELMERYGPNNAHTPAAYPSNAQYRVCEKCFREQTIPAPLHICSEECRGFLSTFMPKWQVDLKLADVGSFTVAWRQKKRLAARVRRAVTFEFDYGPKPGVRPYEHLATNELEDVGADWDDLEADQATEEIVEEVDL